MKNFKTNLISRSLKLVNRSDRRKLVQITIFQISFAMLDLLGVAVIGVLGALAITGVESSHSGNRISSALRIMRIESFSPQSQVALLGILATFIFILRTVLSIVFMRRTILFLSYRSALISQKLTTQLLFSNLSSIKNESSQAKVYALSDGVTGVTVGIIGNFISIIVDSSVLLIVGIGLFAVDPTMAFLSLSLFTLTSYGLYRKLQKSAQKFGKINTEMSIKSNEKILEALNSFRETITSNRQGYYSSLIGELRITGSRAAGELNFLPNVSKYAIEATLVLGGLLIGGYQFATQNATHAVATLSIFMAGGSRIAPAVLRVQQAALNMKGNLESANKTLDLAKALSSISIPQLEQTKFSTHRDGFIPNLRVQNLAFSYPDSDTSTLINIDLQIASGKTLAIVGPSGAGKSTLTDLILGLQPPSSGIVEISGLSPLEAISKFSGAIAYLPQQIAIINGTIRDNIVLGFQEKEFSEDNIMDALKFAHLYDFVQSLPDKLDTEVGDRGSNLSGGQRQRLGLARAYFTKPTFLVLDEATSALDFETESLISKTLETLKGSTTVILIAHRLSTVMAADVIAYLEQGRIVSLGPIEHVRSEVPNFDAQSQLLK
jgi:ATP-binding cassette subfamily C protein